MSLKVLVDTNILIDHLRNVPKATELMEEVENNSYEGLLSTINILELMAAPKMTEKRFESIKCLLDIFEHVPVDSNIAIVAGQNLAKYRASHGLEPMDAIIAATARVSEAVLFTLNIKHFRFIEGLVAINPYTVQK
ncbi:PIN domain-containing protein [Desulfoscipio gibsoniae]